MNEFICYCPNLYCKCKSGCNCLREKTDDIQLDNQWCLCCELAKINYQQKKQLGNDVKKMELETGEDKLYGKVILNSGKIIKSNGIELSSSRGIDTFVDKIYIEDGKLFLKFNSGDIKQVNLNSYITDTIKYNDGKLTINNGEYDINELIKQLDLNYNSIDGKLKLTYNINGLNETINDGITIPILTAISKNNNKVTFERGDLPDLTLELDNGIKNINYVSGNLKWTYLDGTTGNATVNTGNGCDCNIKDIELNGNVLEFIKTDTSDNFNLDFNTLLTNNDITNISLEGLTLNFNYGDTTKNTTINLPNSITNITSSNNTLTMSKINGSSTANIINNLSLSVNNKNLQLNINGKTTTIPLNNLQTTQDGDPITCTMNTFDCDYIKHTYEIGCCGNKQTLKIFDNYHDIVTLDETSKYKSIIFSNYYTLEGDELKFDIESTLNNLNYSLMLGGTKIIGAEELQNKVYSIDFTGVFEDISELTGHQNYSKLKKIWCNDDYINKLNSDSIIIIKFE